MHKHHQDSINNMIEHYREDTEIKALFLIGSVATGTERPDSDIDAVAVVSDEYHEQKKLTGLEEVYFGKCTYEGGYFNIHYMTVNELNFLAEQGSEPMRNMFSGSVPLYCDIQDLPKLVEKIPVFQKEEGKERQFKFYCTFRMFYNYFWCSCKPTGYMRHHVADGMIYNLYRLILIENEVLFPSMRKLEEYVQRAPKKPENIIEKCHAFMETLSDNDCLALIESYEGWTAYDYPKNHNVVMNNFYEPYEY